MSLRQIRRIRELAENDKAVSGSPGSSSEDDLPALPVRKSAFARLEDSDSSSSDSSDGAEVRNTELPSGTAPLSQSSKVAPKSSNSRKPRQDKSIVAEPKSKSVMDESLDLSIRLLNPSSELRRIFGSTANTARGIKRAVSRRKHWLIEPEANWPMVVPFSFKMEACGDGSFRLTPDSAYERKLEILARIVLTHDVEALYHFVELNPFHAHGLVQLASVLISQRSEFEAAYGLVRRAIFAYQSAFVPSFHPDKSVILSPDSFFSSSRLRALLLYSHLLSGQGCVRTSLEVMKLVYAMEGGMIRGCPKTHAILHLDSLGVKAGNWEWIVKFGIGNGLVDVLPGWALGVAIGLKQMEGGESDDGERITSEKIIRLSRRTLTNESSAETALIRAVCLFPDLFRNLVTDPLLVSKHTADPFTNKLIQAFISKGGLEVIKSNEKILTWIRLVLKKVRPLDKLIINRPAWITHSFNDVTATEFAWGASASYTEPTGILNDETELISMYANDGVVEPAVHAPSVASHPVSLDSNPLAAFLQTLLPWSTIDRTGTEATPVTATGLLDHLRTTLGMGRTINDQIIQEASDSDNDHRSASEEEIDME
jgi:hypothetical protein